MNIVTVNIETKTSQCSYILCLVYINVRLKIELLILKKTAELCCSVKFSFYFKKEKNNSHSKSLTRE